MPRIWLVRHGETEWSTSRRHTGLTDLPLTPQGEEQSLRLRQRLAGHTFSLVLCSPLRRARDTCVNAGYGDRAQVENDLHEWDYGAYEGRTTDAIRLESPGWDIWSSGVPGGETVADVGARVDRIIARALQAQGEVALFAHAHVMRVLAARWLGMQPDLGRAFALDTASVSILGREREHCVVELWNDTSHLKLT